MSETYEADPQDATEGHDEQAHEGAEPHGLEFLQWAMTAPNIAEHLDDGVLSSMGSKVCEEFEIDETSRTAEGWDERADSAMKLALQVREEKSYPWQKASNVKYPLISTAAIQFNARAYPAIIDGPNIVKGQVLGEPTPEKQDRALRIGRHMSYQLLQEMDDWEEDTDRLLMMLPIVGCAFRKSYFDPLKGYNCSHVVSAKDFVVNYWTKDLDSCPRGTHCLEFYPHQIAEKMRSGVWLDVELGAPEGNDDQAPHQFLEQYRLWDLDGDDYPEPYIITVHKETQKVVRVVARFDQKGVQLDDNHQVVRITPTRVFTKYGFIPSPDGSFYDIGFGTLLNPLSETINSTINQLMDAGHLSNVQGGFIGSGVSIKSGSLRFQPGEWKKADSGGQPLSQAIVPLPVREPSSVLFQLLGMLIESAKDVTATQNILSGDSSSASTPVGTVMALIEQGLKTFTAIVKRIHRALKHELGVLYDLNGKYLNPQDYFTFQDVQGVIAQQDYNADDVDVVPVSDPSMATDMQKMGRVQFLMSMRGQGLNDMAINQFALETAGIPDPKRFLPQGPPPPDPKMLKDAADTHIKAQDADTRAAIAESTIAVNMATAQNTMAQALMASPQMAQMVAQFVDARVQNAMQGLQHGGEPQVQPQDVHGMASGAGQPGVLPVPEGHLGGLGAPMGGGGADVGDPAAQGGPVPGAGQPGMG